MPAKKICRCQPGTFFGRCISASESIIFADISEPLSSGWASRTGRNSYCHWQMDKKSNPPLKVCVPTLCIVLHMIEPGHLQGNIIYPCGYTGGAKDRVSAVASFESASVSLSSADGIAQIERDKEFQAENDDKCLQVGGGCGGCLLSSNSRKATGKVTAVCKCVCSQAAYCLTRQWTTSKKFAALAILLKTESQFPWSQR